MNYNLILNHFDYSTNLEGGWILTPCNDPRAADFVMVSTLGMLSPYM